MKIMSLVVLAIFSLTTAGQTPADSSIEARPFVRVERIGEATARSFFVFATTERNYTIRHDGHGETYAARLLRKNFDLKMNGARRLDRLYFLEQGTDLLLLYEVTDGKSNWAYLLRFDQKAVRLKWIAAVNAINIGPAAVEDESGYLTATNFIARIDLLSGKYVWQQKNFSLEQTMEFQLPVLTPDLVWLREDKEEGSVLKIDKASGRIINSSLLGSPVSFLHVLPGFGD